MVSSSLQPNLKSLILHFILISIIFSLITLKMSFLWANDEITITSTDTTFSEIEDLEDDIIEIRSKFEDLCVREAGSAIALPSFIYTYYNLKIANAVIKADRFSFSGPFRFNTNIAAADASNGKFSGLWELFDNTVFTSPLGLDFVVPFYTVENGYIQGVVINYYNVPPTDGSAGSCPIPNDQNFCPNAWNGFVSEMDPIKTTINANGPSTTLNAPTKLFQCIEYKYVPKPATAETTGAFIDSVHAPYPLSVPPVSPTGSALPSPIRDLTKY